MKRFVVIIFLLLQAVFAMAQDWANFGRYEAANEVVTTRPLAVLMGDSITDSWARADSSFFADNNFVGRGISGQCTSHMLVRFRKDVIALSPKYVVILGGINDIARNPGSAGKIEDIMGNIASMCELAKANRIRPVLCTLTPGAYIPWRNNEPVADRVAELNRMIRAYAAENHIRLIDYYTPLAGPDGVFMKQYTYDGIHPTLAGYREMEKMLLKVVR